MVSLASIDGHVLMLYLVAGSYCPSCRFNKCQQFFILPHHSSSSSSKMSDVASTTTEEESGSHVADVRSSSPTTDSEDEQCDFQIQFRPFKRLLAFTDH